MAFEINLPEAARRHLQAADALDAGHRRDVAGYLYGIAAECALKKMMERVSWSPKHDKNEAFYEHFPKLRTLIRDGAQGRNAAALMKLVESDAFMNNWHINMRYADAQQIKSYWVDDWKKQAHDAVNAMETA